ncbi:MAG: hypothetical protein AB7O97_14320 [Planctomycetota bacterium]
MKACDRISVGFVLLLTALSCGYILFLVDSAPSADPVPTHSAGETQSPGEIENADAGADSRTGEQGLDARSQAAAPRAEARIQGRITYEDGSMANDIEVGLAPFDPQTAVRTTASGEYVIELGRRPDDLTAHLGIRRATWFKHRPLALALRPAATTDDILLAEDVSIPCVSEASLTSAIDRDVLDLLRSMGLHDMAVRFCTQSPGGILSVAFAVEARLAEEVTLGPASLDSNLTSVDARIMAMGSEVPASEIGQALFELKPGSPTRVHWRLNRRLLLAGRVVDSRGAPIGAPTVRISVPDARYRRGVRTGSVFVANDGTFLHVGRPGQETAIVHANWRDWSTTAGDVPLGDLARDIVLDTSSGVPIRVLLGGRAVEQLQIGRMPWFMEGKAESDLPRCPEGRTWVPRAAFDASAPWVFSWWQEGRPRETRIALDGLADDGSAEVHLDGVAADLCQLEVRLGTRDLRVRLTSLDDPNEWHASSWDYPSDDVAHFAGLMPGTYRLRVRHKTARPVLYDGAVRIARPIERVDLTNTLR